MEGDASFRIVPVSRTNKDHCPTSMVQSLNFSLNFKFELGLVEPNRTAIALDRDLADV
jgi:hypothetical protein